MVKVPRVKNLRGKCYVKNLRKLRFGKLKVVSLKTVLPKVGALWNCLCDCGESHTASTRNLLAGRVTQCRECSNRSRATKRAIAWNVKKGKSENYIRKLFHSLNNSERQEVIAMLKHRNNTGVQKIIECIKAVRPSLKI